MPDLEFTDYLRSPTCWSLFLFGFGATAALTPWVMWLARKTGMVDRGGYRKVSQVSMPLLGGLAVGVPFIVLCIFASFSPTGMFSLVSDRRVSFLVLAFGGILILALGIVDDLRSMRARTKLIAQAIVALLVCATGHTLTFIDTPFTGRIEFGSFVGVLLTVIWIVGLTNAFNIIDGVDGLAAGIALIATAGLTILAALSGDTFLVLLGVAFASSLLGFLLYNFHPARIFLGDAGSMFIGFEIAVIALMSQSKTQATTVLLPPVLVLGLPILETLVSMLRRFIRGRPLFAADAYHTHHRLLRKGLSQRQTVLLLYAVAFLFSLAGILSHTIDPAKSRLGMLPYVLYGATLAAVAWVAGYIHSPKTARKVIRWRNQTTVLTALANYATLALSGEKGSSNANDIFRVIRTELRLHFVSAWFEDGPVLIGSSGVLGDDRSDLTHLDSVERLRIKSIGGKDVIIRFRLNQELSPHELEDVSACLVRIFEHAKIDMDKLEVPQPNLPEDTA